MTKTIYLHIGTNKTGTTTIQVGLSQSKADLEARGFVYPCLTEKETSHANIVRELKGQPEFKPTFCTLAQLQAFIEQTPYKHIIISTETFSWVSVKELQKFVRYLNGYQVKVIVYLRRQDQLIQSLWANRVKISRLTAPFGEWFDEIVQEKHRLSSDSPILRNHPVHILHYDELIAKYASVFGKENMMVRAYERSYMNNNIFADFLQFIGMDDVAWIPESTNYNITPSVKTLEFVRQMTISWYKNMGQSLGFIPWSIKYYFKDLREIADRLGWNDQRLNLIDQARYDHAMQVYGEGNDRIAQTYLGRDKLFREPFTERPMTTFDTSDFQNDELITMMQEMGTIHLQMLKKPKKKTRQVYSKPSLATKLMRRLQSLLQR